MNAARRLEVRATGPRALIQDAGRFGLMAIGVGRSGAADQAAFWLGNRLLGNPASSAAVEVIFGGLVAVAGCDLWVCVTGAPVPVAVGSRGAAFGVPVAVPAGAELRLGRPVRGVRSYLAVRGGLDVPPVLGSCSTDTLSGLGPAPLAPGDVLPVGERAGRWPEGDVIPVHAVEDGPLRVLPGPRTDWFADPSELTTATWTVSSDSDRIGVRLTGAVVRRTPERESDQLDSEPMVRGAIQVPPNGEPVLFLNDHPVTGGYPVVGVLAERDVDRAAQLAPGDRVRFTLH